MADNWREKSPLLLGERVRVRGKTLPLRPKLRYNVFRENKQLSLFLNYGSTK